MEIRLLPLLVVVAGLSIAAAQARADSEGQRVPTVTRLVKLFTTLEYELATAVQRNDSATANGMLVDDFELRSGALPGVPTPRADWLRHSQGKAVGEIEQMAVHDYGTVAVVSFLWKAGERRNVFVVDVWRKSGDTWKLSVRYASPGGDRQFSIPGAVLEAHPVEKKM